jgi:hypothetical protein
MLWLGIVSTFIGIKSYLYINNILNTLIWNIWVMHLNVHESILLLNEENVIGAF